MTAAVERASTLRPTEPAPASTTETRTDVPSARPTTAPPFDFAALAQDGVRLRIRADLPLEHAILVRVATAPAETELDHCTAFVLAHVDGASTVATIAEHAQLPLHDVVGAFVELLAFGLVRLAPPPTVPPTSGIFAKARV